MDYSMITSKEILLGTGIQSGKTLTRWYQRGLIPKPEVRIHPSGNGKMAYWPSWVLNRCVRIKDLVARGRSLDEISDLLKTIGIALPQEAKTYARRDVNVPDTPSPDSFDRVDPPPPLE